MFEDYVDAQDTSILGVTKARQAASHPNWMRANVPSCLHSAITSVIVAPIKKVKSGAVSQLDDVAFWALDEFKSWAEHAISVVRELRVTFNEPGDLLWRAAAAEKLEQHTLDAPGLVRRLKANLAAKCLQPVK